MFERPHHRRIAQVLQALDGDVRADQYGIRTLVQADDGRADLRPIKFEIVHEARIVLDAPVADEAARISGISTLTDLDLATTKLLANADRWRDDAVFSRDLIDLALMVPPPALLRQAIAKASTAYGDAIPRDLRAATDALRQRPGRLEACLQALQITLPKAVVWGHIRRLGKGL